jgi:hypothetical protein
MTFCLGAECTAIANLDVSRDMLSVRHCAGNAGWAASIAVALFCDAPIGRSPGVSLGDIRKTFRAEGVSRHQDDGQRHGEGERRAGN